MFVANIKYEDIVRKEIDRARAVYNAGLTDLSKVITLAIDGGNCIRCGEGWASVLVNNKYADYTYYRPECKCYPVCVADSTPGCSRVLYEEWHSDGTVKNTRIKNGQQEYRIYIVCSNCRGKQPVTKWQRSTAQKKPGGIHV